jgi:hypothetical protein
MYPLSMSYLILSNIMITKEIIDENMLDLMMVLKNSLKFLKSDKL